MKHCMLIKITTSDFIAALSLCSIGQNTFELVTASKVLHVCATSPFEVMEWIDAIREAISRSYLGESHIWTEHLRWVFHSSNSLKRLVIGHFVLVLF